MTTVTKRVLAKERGKKESVLVNVGANEQTDIYGSPSSKCDRLDGPDDGGLVKNYGTFYGTLRFVPHQELGKLLI